MSSENFAVKLTPEQKDSVRAHVLELTGEACVLVLEDTAIAAIVADVFAEEQTAAMLAVKEQARAEFRRELEQGAAALTATLTGLAKERAEAVIAAARLEAFEQKTSGGGPKPSIGRYLCTVEPMDYSETSLTQGLNFDGEDERVDVLYLIRNSGCKLEKATRLVAVTFGGLGLEADKTIFEVIERGLALGLRCCPVAAMQAPELRDMRETSFVLATDPHLGNSHIYSLAIGCEKGCWLAPMRRAICDEKVVFIFALPD